MEKREMKNFLTILYVLLQWVAFGISIYAARIDGGIMWILICIIWGGLSVLSTIDIISRGTK